MGGQEYRQLGKYKWSYMQGLTPYLAHGFHRPTTRFFAAMHALLCAITNINSSAIQSDWLHWLRLMRGSSYMVKQVAMCVYLLQLTPGILLLLLLMMMLAQGCPGG